MRTQVKMLLVAGIAGSLTLGLAAVAAQPAVADRAKDTPYTFAVIGDIPYGDAEIAAFPKVVDQINADPAVRWVDHLGDIKNGSSVCSDDYFTMVKTQFDRFHDPLVYAVGDNEWTDCHRANNGGYDPLERLAKVRSVFFPNPGRTLGVDAAKVDSQAEQGIPENVSWSRADVSFAAMHVVGSNNSLTPWTGKTAPTPAQTAEVLNRTAYTIREIDDTFADARKQKNKAVVLLIQADMFDPTAGTPLYADLYGFTPIVQAIARQAAAFTKPVYLFNGDSHAYNVDKPLAAGSSWASFYGVTTAAPNLTRITVDGSNNASNYLRVSITSNRTAPLSWEKVPFTS